MCSDSGGRSRDGRVADSSGSGTGTGTGSGTAVRQRGRESAEVLEGGEIAGRLRNRDGIMERIARITVHHYSSRVRGSVRGISAQAGRESRTRTNLIVSPDAAAAAAWTTSASRSRSRVRVRSRCKLPAALHLPFSSGRPLSADGSRSRSRSRSRTDTNHLAESTSRNNMQKAARTPSISPSGECELKRTEREHRRGLIDLSLALRLRPSCG